MRSFIILLIITIALPDFIRSTPIDNGVEGDPEIECAADSITVNFNTRNEFNGHVYVKGRFADKECRNDDGGRRVAGIKLPFTTCGTKRERSLSPKGVTVSNTVVITFHPQFLTKVDRAYTVQCFYMEADKTVSQDLEVSEITTAFQTQVVPMPLCRYEILDGGPTGEPVKFATIGQMVYHKWSCETETVDIFCALIHSCYVDDGAGNHADLLNEKGCALDKFLLNNLEYQTDLMAGHESHVFKYADKPALFFQCQISISIKDPGSQCSRPQCPEPGGPGAGAGATASASGRSTAPAPAGTKPPSGSSPKPSTTARSRPTALAPAPSVDRARDTLPAQFPFRFRYARAVREDPVGTWDVAAQAITALELDDEPHQLPDTLKRLQSNNSTLPFQAKMENHSFCISPVSFGLLFTFMVISILTSLFVIFLTCVRRTNKI